MAVCSCSLENGIFEVEKRLTVPACRKLFVINVRRDLFLQTATYRVYLLTLDYAVGKTMAFTSIKFTNGKGDIVARGSHTKYVSPFLRQCHWPAVNTKLHGKGSADGRR